MLLRMLPLPRFMPQKMNIQLHMLNMFELIGLKYLALLPLPIMNHKLPMIGARQQGANIGTFASKQGHTPRPHKPGFFVV